RGLLARGRGEGHLGHTAPPAEPPAPAGAARLRARRGAVLGRVGVRLPDSAHTSRPWRIHELAGDFRLEDVWALPTPGGPDDFPRLVERMVSFDPSRASSAAGALFAVRSVAGA